MENVEKTSPTNFIKDIIDEDIRTGKNKGQVVTRFPPEPNGYLHIGHAKSICLNFGLAKQYGGRCHLRMDDTNPEKEDVEYTDSIINDVRWLGFDWGEHLYYASDYFEQIYQWAVLLINKGLAYVSDMTPDEVSATRGTPTVPGKEDPGRKRGVEENLDLFARMKAGEFPDGTKTLRARINMASPNMHMRDPVLYRLKRDEHHRTGNKWCIYPMYDFAHGQSDYIEGITHSICTLEFEVHRPLYDWFLDQIADAGKVRPRQIEFARLSLSYTVMSKRKLLELVQTKIVRGWDDPRMPTISGLRRRGYTPESIRDFADRIGVAKADNIVEAALLEHCVREDLNRRAPRVIAVLDPLKVVIENYPEGKTEMMEAVNNPEDESMGKREIPFSRVLYIEREDFREEAPPKFFRLAPGKEVRFKFAYYLKCTGVVKDDSGKVVEVRCAYDPATRGGWSQDGRKVKGTIHWLSADRAIPAEVRLYEYLFTDPNPDNPAEEGADYKSLLNPNSLKVLDNCLVEPSLKGAKPGTSYQFERLGYFCVDPDTSGDKLVFNRTVTLKDSKGKD
ncbi:MAG: glutamine--tRNA ligase/YqeY domain fusion protein [Spirochaetes bacterium]|nr:glutamine--tRNA ligase/YqeY domain fusion protein [Spirochaetota bacterium]